MKKFLSLVLYLLLASMPTQTFAAVGNYQDLWWASPAGSESGWGINIAQQSDILFATWFIYASNGQPLWLVMSNGGKVSEGVYQGDIYQTTGPAFSAPFTSAPVTVNKIGSATLTFSSMTQGTLAYTYNGVAVTKNITRQTWSYLNTSGRYQVLLKEVRSDCSNPADNGTSVQKRTAVVAGDLAAKTLTWTVLADAQHTSTCTLTANNLTQSGSLLIVDGMLGSITCTGSAADGAIVGSGVWGTGTWGELRFGSEIARGQFTVQATDGSNCTDLVKFSGVRTQ